MSRLPKRARPSSIRRLRLAADYTKTHSGVTIAPAATNSVAGVEQAISGAVQIGASDAYMSDGEVEQNPLIINVPMAISAQTVQLTISPA